MCSIGIFQNPLDPESSGLAGVDAADLSESRLTCSSVTCGACPHQRLVKVLRQFWVSVFEFFLRCSLSAVSLDCWFASQDESNTKLMGNVMFFSVFSVYKTFLWKTSACVGFSAIASVRVALLGLSSAVLTSCYLASESFVIQCRQKICRTQ